MLKKIIRQYPCYILLFNIINVCASIIDLDSIEQLHKEISGHTTPVLLVFGAEWCGACQTIKKPLAEVLNESEFANITTIHIDINKFPELVNEFNIVGIPTLKFFMHGTETGSTMGAIDPTTYKDDLRKDLRSKFNIELQAQQSQAKNESSEKSEMNNEQKEPSEMKQEEEANIMEKIEEQPTQPSPETGFFAHIFNSIAAFFKKIVDVIKSIFGY